ncbi:MAG: tryptophan-rich sensory protein [Oscillospiraceae bacterium]|nr:tryptophan-rich sensory protein [Oscillospiraceae bacterium]
MKREGWKVYVFWVVLAEAVGIVSGLLSREGIMVFPEIVEQPPLSPPAVVFPVVWSVLYALMGLGAARIWLSEPSSSRDRGLDLFVAQLVLNFFWTPIFFDLQAYGLALVWSLVLWSLVLWMILEYRKVDMIAAWSQVPYLIWSTFAVYLNAGVWASSR